LISREFEKKFPDLHGFSHGAMAAVFEIFVLYPDKNYAAQAAAEAFSLLDRLDGELSRFNPNGDVSRINCLKPGDVLSLGLDSFHCLLKAREINRITKGAFDVTAGRLKDDWLKKDGNGIKTASIGMRHLLLDETQWTVSTDAPVGVDLGAIGKGYAVDRMGELLREWALENWLIHGGNSSVLALGGLPGHDGWPVAVRHPSIRNDLLVRPVLLNQGMGGSGLERGLHIIDPLTQKPADKVLAAWVVADDAAAADALSTAFMIMEKNEADALCIGENRIHALAVYRENAVISRWGM
jgi:thiamine biosynthesis lipoprotein